MSRLTARKYQALLIALLGLVVVFPLVGSAADTRLVLYLFVTLVFLTSLVVIFDDRGQRVAAALLGVPSLAGLWTGYLLPGAPRLPLAVGFHLLAILFFAFTIRVVLRDVFRERDVSVDGVCGAFCGYLMTALAFAHLYNVLELLAPGSFRGADFTPQMADEHRHYLLTYFSLITLTTVGFGDVTPAGAARGLVAVEAVVGQFYIAVLVAALIGKRVGRAPDPPEK
jgi:hypothetical protein